MLILIPPTMNQNISFLQTFGILLVVIGHALCLHPDWFLFDWIYSFHMPLFMFISGYLYTIQGNKNQSIATGKFTQKKALRLLVPYLVISTAGFLCKALLNSYAVRTSDISFMGYLHSISYPNENAVIPMWFLPTLFLIITTSHILLRQFKNDCPILFLLGCSILSSILAPHYEAMPLNLNIALHYYKWWAIGYFFCKYTDCVTPRLKLTHPITTFILSTLSIVTVWSQRNGYTPHALHTLTPIVGILMSLSIAHLYTRLNYNPLRHLYGHSFQIYLLSWFPQSFVNTLGYNILDLSPLWVIPANIILAIYLPILVSNILSRNRLTAICIGR